jgi:superfamily II DNA/RNA helicase
MSALLVDPIVEIMPVTPGNYVRSADATFRSELAGEKSAPMSEKEFHEYPGQIQHFIEHTESEIKKGGRVLATTLTKKMAEDLSEYLKERKIKSEYLHSDVKTIDRIKIITEFRRGKFDCLVGVNLLREGLDMPEVTFIGILDAEAFLNVWRIPVEKVQIVRVAVARADRSRRRLDHLVTRHRSSPSWRATRGRGERLQRIPVRSM